MILKRSGVKEDVWLLGSRYSQRTIADMVENVLGIESGLGIPNLPLMIYAARATLEIGIASRLTYISHPVLCDK